ADPDARAAVRGLHEAGIAEGLLDGLDKAVAPGFEVASPQDTMIDDRETGLAEHDLHHRLVHPQRRTQDTRADVGDVRQLEEPLQRALLSAHAMNDREDDIEPPQRPRVAARPGGGPEGRPGQGGEPRPRAPA